MKIIEKSLADTVAFSEKASSFNNTDPKIFATVNEIINNVIQNGDTALKEYSKKFDQTTPDNLLVPQSEIDKAYNNADSNLLKALQTAKANITSFHKNEIDQGFIDTPTKGVMRGQKVIPLEKVGLYVPGGTAAYPSTILMSAIPANIAGVQDIIMVTPPQKDGINPAILVAAKLVGVSKIYQVGGAQAIAALAFGTETIPKVDKIMGPGNIFVATAKKQVYGQVDIDMIAGPSEICVVAGDSADPKQVAADLLSQAEHDKRSRPILITPKKELAEKVNAEIDRQLQTLPRAEIARAAVENQGFIAVVDSVDDALTVANAVAPEHLEIQLDNASQYLAQIKNAGSVFLGYAASEPLGDYVAGPNHILPTSGTARFFSPLGVYDFVKRTQFVQYTQSALEKVAGDITTLARVEGLEGHARGIESRF